MLWLCYGVFFFLGGGGIGAGQRREGVASSEGDSEPAAAVSGPARVPHEGRRQGERQPSKVSIQFHRFSRFSRFSRLSWFSWFTLCLPSARSAGKWSGWGSSWPTGTTSKAGRSWISNRCLSSSILSCSSRASWPRSKRRSAWFPIIWFHLGNWHWNEHAHFKQMNQSFITFDIINRSPIDGINASNASNK